MYFFERKKKRLKILDKSVVEKSPVVANFHDFIKSCRDRKSSVIFFNLGVSY